MLCHLCDNTGLNRNVRVVGILSVWVEFDELYFSYLLKMLDPVSACVDALTGRVDCFGYVCALQTLR